MSPMSSRVIDYDPEKEEVIYTDEEESSSDTESHRDVDIEDEDGPAGLLDWETIECVQETGKDRVERMKKVETVVNEMPKAPAPISIDEFEDMELADVTEECEDPMAAILKAHTVSASTTNQSIRGGGVDADAADDAYKSDKREMDAEGDAADPWNRWIGVDRKKEEEEERERQRRREKEEDRQRMNRRGREKMYGDRSRSPQPPSRPRRSPVAPRTTSGQRPRSPQNRPARHRSRSPEAPKKEHSLSARPLKERSRSPSTNPTHESDGVKHATLTRKESSSSSTSSSGSSSTSSSSSSSSSASSRTSSAVPPPPQKLSMAELMVMNRGDASMRRDERGHAMAERRKRRADAEEMSNRRGEDMKRRDQRPSPSRAGPHSRRDMRLSPPPYVRRAAPSPSRRRPSSSREHRSPPRRLDRREPARPPIPSLLDQTLSPPKRDQRASPPRAIRGQGSLPMRRAASPPRRRDQRPSPPPRRQDQRVFRDQRSSPPPLRDQRPSPPRAAKDQKSSPPRTARDQRSSPPPLRGQRPSPPRAAKDQRSSPVRRPHPRSRDVERKSPPRVIRDQRSSPPQRVMKDQRASPPPRRGQRLPSPPRQRSPMRDQKKSSDPGRRLRVSRSPLVDRAASPPRRAVSPLRRPSPSRSNNQRSSPVRRVVRSPPPRRDQRSSPPRVIKDQRSSPLLRRDQRRSPPRWIVNATRDLDARVSRQSPVRVTRDQRSRSPLTLLTKPQPLMALDVPSPPPTVNYRRESDRRSPIRVERARDQRSSPPRKIRDQRSPPKDQRSRRDKERMEERGNEAPTTTVYSRITVAEKSKEPIDNGKSATVDESKVTTTTKKAHVPIVWNGEETGATKVYRSVGHVEGLDVMKVTSSSSSSSTNRSSQKVSSSTITSSSSSSSKTTSSGPLISSALAGRLSGGGGVSNVRSSAQRRQAPLPIPTQPSQVVRTILNEEALKRTIVSTTNEDDDEGVHNNVDYDDDDFVDDQDVRGDRVEKDEEEPRQNRRRIIVPVTCTTAPVAPTPKHARVPIKAPSPTPPPAHSRISAKTAARRMFGQAASQAATSSTMRDAKPMMREGVSVSSVRDVDRLFNEGRIGKNKKMKMRNGDVHSVDSSEVIDNLIDESIEKSFISKNQMRNRGGSHHGRRGGSSSVRGGHILELVDNGRPRFIELR